MEVAIMGYRPADFRPAMLMAGLLCLAASPAFANARKQLQDQPFPAPNYHTVTVQASVDPGSQVAPHLHPGIEMVYVLGGRAVLDVQGQPPRPLSTGDSFSIPPRTVHSVRNVGAGPLTLLSTYVVEVGKPVLIPADAAPSGPRHP